MSLQSYPYSLLQELLRQTKHDYLLLINKESIDIEVLTIH